MTGNEIPRYFDMEKIGPYLEGPLKAAVYAAAEDAEKEISRLKKEDSLLSRKIREMQAEYDALGTGRKKDGPLSAEEARHTVLREQLERLLSAGYLVSFHSQPAPKCGFCDDERMITLAAPDGQNIRVPCRCSKDEIRTYSAEPIVKMEPESLTVIRCFTAEEAENIYSDGRRIRLDRIDTKDEMKASDLYSYAAFTTKKKAEDAIRRAGLTLWEEDCDA